MTVVEDFAADYFVAQGLTLGRQHDVRTALAALEAHAGAAPETLDENALRDFVTAQVARGLHVNTVRKHLNAVKPFYRWCWQRRLIDADRFMRIGEVKPPRGSTGNARPRPYTTREVERFWTDLDQAFPLTTDRMLSRWERGMSRWPRVWTHAMHLQVQAIATLALFGGLRRAEIRHSGIDDIHPDNDFIVVRGKSPFGERQGYREVPYTEAGREYVGRWLEFRARIAPTHAHPWLVLTPTASPNGRVPSHPFNAISDDGFERILGRVGAWEFHRFRHTCATEWLRAGVELEKVSRLLGHADIKQTLGYAELVRNDVARGVRKAEADFVTAVDRRQAHLTPEADADAA